MFNFKNLLNEILIEQHKSFHELENNNILGKNTFYEYATFSPYLPKAIEIANYLEVSLDYLANITDKNNFTKYSAAQLNICNKIESIMKLRNISKRELERQAHISRTNFVYWKRGITPKFETLVNLAVFLECHIDDFLDFEE